MSVDRSRLVIVPFAYATELKNGQVYTMLDWWWTVDLERGLVFYVSGSERRPHYHPQANPNRVVTEKVTANLYSPDAFPTLGILQVPMAAFLVDHEGEFRLPKDLDLMRVES